MPAIVVPTKLIYRIQSLTEIIVTTWNLLQPRVHRQAIEKSVAMLDPQDILALDLRLFVPETSRAAKTMVKCLNISSAFHLKVGRQGTWLC
jgi:hypothetical protein